MQLAFPTHPYHDTMKTQDQQSLIRLHLDLSPLANYRQSHLEALLNAAGDADRQLSSSPIRLDHNLTWPCSPAY